jgi:hypothetical protein
MTPKNRKQLRAGNGCILLLLAVGVLTLLPGCGGGSTNNVQNPPPPEPSPVSIAFQPAPPSSVVLNSSATLTAVVANDPAQAGVDWSLLCAASSGCGSLSPLHTASGAAATYTPPSTISGNNQTFTIEAFATSDHTKNLVTPLTVTGFASALKGTYIFQTRGIDANGVFQLAGAIVLDGNGAITSGEQTHSDIVLSIHDPISGGAYYIGPDGRGTITINTADTAIGQQGVENLSLVFLSSSQALIATLDNSNLAGSNETSSGTLDLQTSTAAPTGGYAFSVTGIDLGLQPMAIGGILNIDSPKAISGSGSVADQDDAGSVISDAAVSGTLSDPDSLGRLTFRLRPDFSPTPIQFTGYMVDALHIKLIESDHSSSSAGFGCTAGLAIGQGNATGTFTKNKSFAGTYVFGILGQDLSGLPTSLASAGQFRADSNGNLKAAFNDEFLAGFDIEIADSFTGTYALKPRGTGRVDSNINYDTNGPGPELIFYLTGNGNPALVLDADVNIGSLGAGVVYPQSSPPFSFSGKYGLYLTQSSFGLENNATAQISIDGNANTFSGVVDTDLFLSPQPNTPLTGVFDAIPVSGRTHGALTNTFFPTPGSTPNTLATRYYFIDSGHGFFIETDSVLSGDLTLGYFATRSTVCPTCN